MQINTDALFMFLSAANLLFISAHPISFETPFQAFHYSYHEYISRGGTRKHADIFLENGIGFAHFFIGSAAAAAVALSSSLFQIRENNNPIHEIIFLQRFNMFSGVLISTYEAPLATP